MILSNLIAYMDIYNSSTKLYLLFFTLIVNFALLVQVIRRRRAIITHSDAVTTTLSILDPCNLSLPSQLASRAACNQRLVSAFGLKNTFVSSSFDVHRTFKRDATTLVQKMAFGADGRAARAMRDDAAAAARGVLSASSLVPTLGTAVPFHALIQCVTLSVVLVSLLGADPEHLAMEDLFFVAQGINTLWKLSKMPGAPVPHHLLPEINARLHAWVGGRTAFEQPLDIVVPAFETTWRVVASAIAHAHTSTLALEAFAAFNLKPTHTAFAKELNGLSVEGAIMETLRIHPPTRRIARAVRAEVGGMLSAAALLPRVVLRFLEGALPQWFQPPTEVHRADVEAAHFCARAWGADAGMFDAGRWAKGRVGEEQKKAMFAFGAGKMKCVAQRWAPMAVGIIVAAVLDTLEVEGFEVKAGEKIGGRDDWVGWEVRSVKQVVA